MAGFYDIANVQAVLEAPLVSCASKMVAYGFGNFPHPPSGLLEGEQLVIVGLFAGMLAWPERDTRLRVCRHIPGTLDLESEMDDDDGSLFAVANGLAIERMHWPVVFQPGQIKAVAPSEEVEDKPQGYWYLDAK